MKGDPLQSERRLADSNGATDSIKVIDTQAPSLSASVGVPLLWPPNHDLVNVGLAFSAADNGCGSVTTQIGPFSDVPEDADNFSPDANDIGAGTLRLRAERPNGKDETGRVYLLRVRATDRRATRAAGASRFLCRRATARTPSTT